MSTAQPKPLPELKQEQSAHDYWASHDKRLAEKGILNIDHQSLAEYAQRINTETPVIQMPVATRLSDKQVAAIIGNRAQILFRCARQNRQLEVSDYNRPILNALAYYAMRDQRFETEGWGSLHKGIVLAGLTGCGKTTLIRTLADAGPQQWIHDGSHVHTLADLKRMSWGDGTRFNHYQLQHTFNCLAIEHEYRQKDGEQRIARYFSMHHPAVFDDIGSETTSTKNFGNARNVMEEIIIRRHLLFTESGICTHFTTNLVDMDEFEKMYSQRARVRMREMCNFLVFKPENHTDFRK